MQLVQKDPLTKPQSLVLEGINSTASMTRQPVARY